MMMIISTQLILYETYKEEEVEMSTVHTIGVNVSKEASLYSGSNMFASHHQYYLTVVL